MRILIGTLMIAGAALTGCSAEDADKTTTAPVPTETRALAALETTGALSAEDQAATVRRVVVAWLECEECGRGQLDAVVKLGAQVVPTLAATLSKGPSAASRERLRLDLSKTYREMNEHLRARGEVIQYSEAQYVEMYLANYEALYQIRSAQALSAIGGDDARGALELANSAHSRPDVRRAVEAALKSIRVP